MSRILIMSFLLLACQIDVAGVNRALRDIESRDNLVRSIVWIGKNLKTKQRLPV